MLACAAAAAANYYLVGDPMWVVKSPFYGAAGVDAERRQELILRTDPIGPGTITKIEWRGSTETLTGEFNKFTLRLCDTNRNALTATFEENYEGRTPVEVYAADPLTIVVAPLTWTGVELTTPYAINTATNLIVETWWDGDNGVGCRTFAAAVPGQTRSCASSVVNGVAKNGYPTAGKVGNQLHYMRLTVSMPAVGPSSLGRVKAIFK